MPTNGTSVVNPLVIVSVKDSVSSDDRADNENREDESIRQADTDVTILIRHQFRNRKRRAF